LSWIFYSRTVVTQVAKSIFVKVILFSVGDEGAIVLWYETTKKEQNFQSCGTVYHYMWLSPLWPRLDSCKMQLSDYNFTSVTCEKSASSLTLQNTTGCPQVLWLSPAVTWINKR
jgi:hypothetical protein